MKNTLLLAKETLCNNVPLSSKANSILNYIHRKSSVQNVADYSFVHCTAKEPLINWPEESNQDEVKPREDLLKNLGEIILRKTWGKVTRIAHFIIDTSSSISPKTNYKFGLIWTLKSKLGTVVKNLPANAGDVRCGFHPCVGKIPWRRAWQPVLVFLPGKFHGQKSLADYSP